MKLCCFQFKWRCVAIGAHLLLALILHSAGHLATSAAPEGNLHSFIHSFIHAFIHHFIRSSGMQGDIKKVRMAIVSGVGLPLLMFLAWEAAILGSLGSLGEQQGEPLGDPLRMLVQHDAIVGPLIQFFSFFAIATSFVGFVLGLSDFIADLLQVSWPYVTALSCSISSWPGAPHHCCAWEVPLQLEALSM